FLGCEEPVGETAPHGRAFRPEVRSEEPGSADCTRDRIGLQDHAAVTWKADASENDGPPLLWNVLVATAEFKRRRLCMKLPLPASLLRHFHQTLQRAQPPRHRSAIRNRIVESHR